MISDSNTTIATMGCSLIDNPMGETVRAAQRGDRQAFGRLAERYQCAVYLTVYRRLRNHAEAQEVCQDVLIQAMRKIGQLQDARCFGSWLRSIAGRMAINRAMRRRTAVAMESRRWKAVAWRPKLHCWRAGARAERASPQRAAAARRLGPADAHGLLLRRQQSAGDESAVCLAGRHDQAASARRPQAAGQGVGSPQ